MTLNSKYKHVKFNPFQIGFGTYVPQMHFCFGKYKLMVNGVHILRYYMAFTFLGADFTICISDIHYELK